MSVYMPFVMLAPLAAVRAADVTLPKMPSAEKRAWVLRREAHPLSRREIFQAIQTDLARLGISGRGELRPGDLNIQSSVPLLKDDVGLQVKSIGFDPLRRETVFELWASHEPQYLPFVVTTRRDPQTFGLISNLAGKPGDSGGGNRTENPATGQGAKWILDKSRVLAKPGRPATLLMLGQNVRITTTVVPLQPGIKGQRILVRESTTGRVMNAQVVEEGLLQASF